MPKRLILVVLTIALLASGMSCLGSNSAPVAQLSILKQELTRDETGAMVANITIKNTGNVVAELAEVTVDFYDANRNYVASARDSIINLGPTETWDFVIKCEAERCSEVTTADIKATAGSSSGRF